ncbi:MAG: hypothetical protein PVF83_16145, partial [Anaerolineales bacterium]
MDKESAKSLRQAYDFLKSGNVKSARTMLVEFLKTNPENEQAWYMLSFAVSDQKKQIYSLNQVLKINPSHEKAQNRLSKITGKSPLVSEVKEYPRKKVETVKKIEEPKPQGDLLSQRLFGSVNVSEPQQGETEKHDTPAKKGNDLPPHIVGEPETKPLDLRDEIKPESVVKPPRKNLLSKIPRRTLVLFTLCVVLGGVYILLIDRNKDSENLPPTDQAATEVSGNPTSTYTPQPTATEIGGALPPTWTPVSQEEEEQPFFGEDSIFTITSIDLPTTEVLAEMATIQNQLLSERFENVVNVDSYLISQGEFKNILSDLSYFIGSEGYVEDRELIYRALGLINHWDGLTNYFPNLWADPNGGLYLPDEKAVLIEDGDFGLIEKYLYAREYAQTLIDGELSIDESGIYPVCNRQLQHCQVLYALIKGDATMMAGEWLDNFGPDDQIWMVDDLDVDYFNLPMQSPPLFIEQELDFSHTAGMLFLDALLDNDQEELFNSIYQNLPSTTEQILHPEKYIEGEQEIIVDDIPLNDVLSGDWQEIFNETIGEWLTYQIMVAGVDEIARISMEEAHSAAAGWGGDRMKIYYDDVADEFVISTFWTWDSPEDADEFYNTFADFIQRR